MRGIIALFLLVAISAPALAASWETTSFRTKSGGLVRVGMSADDARREIGPGAAPKAGSGKSRKSETWIYRGHDAVYRVTVVGGQVSRIVVSPQRD